MNILYFASVSEYARSAFRRSLMSRATHTTPPWGIAVMAISKGIRVPSWRLRDTCSDQWPEQVSLSRQDGTRIPLEMAITAKAELAYTCSPAAPTMEIPSAADSMASAWVCTSLALLASRYWL